MSETLDAALAYIARGWPVFPCIPNGKRPLGTLVPNGYLGATLNLELAAHWWTSYPNANVACPTGPLTFDTLDIDVKPTGTGYPAFNRLKAAGILPPPLAILSTPSGGLHCRYPGTSQACGSLPRHFVDWKSSGGYVLMPPSVVNGRAYTLVQERNDGGSQLNWGAVKDFLAPPRPTRTAPTRRTAGTGIPKLAEWLATRTKPGRNYALFWAANRAVENGASLAELHELYRDMQFGNGFSERDAARTVGDAYRTTRRSA